MIKIYIDFEKFCLLHNNIVLIYSQNDETEEIETLFTRAFTEENAYNYQNAYTWYDEILYRDQNNLQALERSAKCLKKLKDYKRAIEIYDKIQKLKNNSDSDDLEYKRIIYKKANCYFYDQNYPKAINIFDEIIKSELDKRLNQCTHIFLKSLYKNGLCFIELKKFKEAIEIFDKISQKLIYLQDHQTNAKKKEKELYVKTYKYKADCLLELKKYEEAIKTYDVIIPQIKFNIGIYNNKALCMLELKKYEEAIKIFDIIIEKDSNYLKAYNNKALCLKELKRNEEAVELYERIIEKDQDNMGAYNNKAICLKHMKKFEEAIRIYDLIIEKDSNYLSAYNNKAACLCEMKKYEEAIILCDTILEKDDSYLKAYYIKAQCLQELKRNKEAIELYNLLIQKNKNVNLEVILNNMLFAKNYFILNELCDYLISNYPFNETVISKKVTALLFLKEYNRAYLFLKQTILINPNNFWIKYELCNLLNLYSSEITDLTDGFNPHLQDEKQFYKKILQGMKDKLQTYSDESSRVDILRQIADTYERLEQDKQALEIYEEILILIKKENQEETMIKKAECLFRLKNYEEAFQMYEELLIFNKSPWLFYNAANCLSKQKKDREALELLNERLESSVMVDENIQLYRADLCREMKLYDLAIKIFDFIINQKVSDSVSDEMKKKAIIGKIDCLNVMKRYDEVTTLFMEYKQNLENFEIK